MQSLIRAAGLLVVAAVFLNGCSSFNGLSESGVEMAQIPVSENPTGVVYPGKFIWHDLLTPDAPSAAKFYEQLFGWQIDYHGHYMTVRNGNKPIAGILQVDPVAGKTRDGVWIPSVSVVDVDKAAGLVTANGGTILKGPVDMDKRGRAVMISDPQQANLVLLAAKGGDPVDTKVAVGGWLWDEIWTENPEAMEKFYSRVLGYDEIVSDNDYIVFMNDGQWRAGVRHLQDSEYMLWIPVVRVADPSATARRAEELGGVAWVTPGEVPGNGNTALIGDTTGALLLIQKWPVEDSKGEN
jgi:predicted enzyme related to lactoylglutathione lyase